MLINARIIKISHDLWYNFIIMPLTGDHWIWFYPSQVWPSLVTTMSICLLSYFRTLPFMTRLLLLSALMLFPLLFVTRVHGDSEFLQFLAAISLTTHSIQLHFFDVDSALAVDASESVAFLLSETTEGGGYFSWADVTREVGNCHVYLSRADHCEIQFIHLIFKESFFQKVWSACFLRWRTRKFSYCFWYLHV